MFGLRALWRSVTGSKKLEKFAHEVEEAFKSAGAFLIHKHGAEIAHIAMNTAITGIKLVSTTDLSGAEKHAQVSGLISDAVKSAGGLFDRSDLNGVIETGLIAFRASQIAIDKEKQQ